MDSDDREMSGRGGREEEKEKKGKQRGLIIKASRNRSPWRAQLPLGKWWGSDDVDRWGFLPEVLIVLHLISYLVLIISVVFIFMRTICMLRMDLHVETNQLNTTMPNCHPTSCLYSYLPQGRDTEAYWRIY
jgi:hypothetical protein